MARSREGPEWLNTLLTCPSYFDTCETHARIGTGLSSRKFFCIQCGDVFCTPCIKQHLSIRHPILQIRTTSNAPSIGVEDAQRIIDTSEIQHYKINDVVVYFLRSRPQKERQKARYHCEGCERYLHESAGIFCSIECKLMSLPAYPELTLSLSKEIDYDELIEFPTVCKQGGQLNRLARGKPLGVRLPKGKSRAKRIPKRSTSSELNADARPSRGRVSPTQLDEMVTLIKLEDVKIEGVKLHRRKSSIPIRSILR